jgi:hypothetical protein
MSLYLYTHASRSLSVNRYRTQQHCVGMGPDDFPLNVTAPLWERFIHWLEICAWSFVVAKHNRYQSVHIALYDCEMVRNREGHYRRLVDK